VIYVRRVVGVKLDDNEVCYIWKMVSMAKGEIARVDSSHGTVCELRGGMWEHGVPPLKELGWITFWRDWVVSSAVASRYYTEFRRKGTLREVKLPT